MAVTLKEKAYVALKTKILEGTFKPGEFLTEIALVELLGMSRTPIRSALERLDVEGIVNYIPNKGINVAELSIDRAVDIYDYRTALETHVVRKLALRTLTADEVQWFEENLQDQQNYMEHHNFAQFTTSDSAFHSKLALVYGNREIIQAIEQLQDRLFQIAMKVLSKDPTRIGASYNDHAQLFELIKEGHAEEAVKRMIEHLEYGKRILIS